MPVKIYWGPPGSYKSSAAIWDDVSACAKQGRVLITNVRGLSEARVASVLTDIKPGFRIMHFRMDRPTEMAVLRRWWHWAPFGAYFLLDEVQAIYPPFWTAKQMRELDGPTDRDRQWPSGETMPKEMEICFDMHRHGNWDFTFTTPNIKKVRPEIRACAEWAYKHRNLAFTGLFRGSFMEFQHSAEDNASPSDIFAIRRRKVPAYVFQLYDSTATGTAKDSTAGGSIFTSPYFLALAGFFALVLALVASRPIPPVLVGKPPREASSEKTHGPFRVHDGSEGLQRPERPLGAPVQPNEAPAAAQGAQAPEQPPELTEARTSNRWRLLGVLTDKTGQGIALLGSAGARRRISASQCHVVDNRNEWECTVDGEVVTRWTGLDPIGEVMGDSKPAPG